MKCVVSGEIEETRLQLIKLQKGADHQTQKSHLETLMLHLRFVGLIFFVFINLKSNKSKEIAEAAARIRETEPSGKLNKTFSRLAKVLDGITSSKTKFPLLSSVNISYGVQILSKVVKVSESEYEHFFSRLAAGLQIKKFITPLIESQELTFLHNKQFFITTAEMIIKEEEKRKSKVKKIQH